VHLDVQALIKEGKFSTSAVIVDAGGAARMDMKVTNAPLVEKDI